MTEMVKEADRYYVYAVVDITEGLEVLGRKTLLYCLKGHPKTGEPLPVFRSEEDATEFLRTVGVDKAVIARLEVAY